MIQKSQLTPELWQRVQALFHDALQITQIDRQTWVKDACNTDFEARDIVLKMLATDAKVNNQMIVPANQFLDCVEQPEQKIGEELGPYRIASFLGAGGMGQVFRAVRVDGVVIQEVAIKLLRYGAMAAELKRRFEIERRILARLCHPGIVRFIDAGSDAAGRPYVVMELVDGLPITQYANSKILGLHDRLKLFVQVLDTVSYAHSQLIVHRDIKPSNVLVDKNGMPHLLDFGIARPLLDIDGALRAGGATQTTWRTYSLKYAAPEQIRGDPIAIGSDIYALGGLLYELLTDCTSLELQDLTLLKAQELILHQMPAAPSFRKLDGCRIPYTSKDLKGDLDRIVLHALKKEANKRYITVDAFALDVRHHLQQQPISLRSGVTSYRFWKFVYRHKMSVAITALLLVSLISFSVVFALQANRLQIEKENALFSATKAQRERDRAQAVSRFMVRLFQSARTVENKNTNPTVKDLLLNAGNKVQEDIANGVEIDWRIIDSLSSAHISQGLWEKSEALFKLADMLAKKDPYIQPAELLRLTLNRVDGSLMNNKIDKAKALLFQTKTPAIDSADSLILEMFKASYLIDATLQSEEFEHALKSLLPRSIATVGENDMSTFQIRLRLANHLKGQNKLFEAQSHYEPLRAQTLLLPLTHARRIAVALSFGGLLARRGDFERAEKMIFEGVNSAKELYGESSPAYAQPLISWALFLARKLEYSEAIKNLKIAREIYVSALGANSSRIFNPTIGLIAIYVKQNNFSEAERELLSIQKFIGSESELDTAAQSEWTIYSARIQNELQNYDNVLTICNNFEPKIKQINTSTNTLLAQIQLEKTFAFFKLGKLHDAELSYLASLQNMGANADEWDKKRQSTVGALLTEAKL